MTARIRRPGHLAVALVFLLVACSRTGLDVDDGVESIGAELPCTPGTFGLTRAEPAVMFVLDRSGSMDDEFSAGLSRWQVLTSALAATLPPVDSTMQIGALLFPSPGAGQGTGAGAPPGGGGDESASCSIPRAPDLTPATGHVSALIAAMKDSSPAGGTPTSAALTEAAQVLSGVRAATRARAMVLATDGGPNCNASLDADTCTCADLNVSCVNDALECLDDTRTIDVIGSYASQGLPTYVIGIQDPGDTTLTQVLTEMAVAGGRPQTGAATSYYAATSATELEDALVAIRDQVGACTFLTVSVPGTHGSIVITAGGVVIPYDPTGQSGWSWGDESNGQIVLAASACQAATASGAPTAQVACDVPDASGD